MSMTRMHEVPTASPLVAIDYEKEWKHSAKTSRLMMELETLRKNEPTTKCVIFSQWTLMLDLLQIPLDKAGFHYCRLDGSMSQPQRERVLAQFAKPGGATIMLISLKAGGVGLNLVTASVVYFMDAWWNPAVEDQAIQRVHRIGQTRTVRVYRFVVQHTIEQQIGMLQQRKKHLAQSIGMNEDEQKQLRLDDLRSLFAAL
jgi:DNA repair protein RAD5